MSQSRDLTQALDALMAEKARADYTPLPGMPERGAAPKAVAAAPMPAGQGGKPSGGGNIASPLTESATASREYYTDANWVSSDGLFAFAAIKKLVMTDANGASVEFQFARPS